MGQNSKSTGHKNNDLLEVRNMVIILEKKFEHALLNAENQYRDQIVPEKFEARQVPEQMKEHPVQHTNAVYLAVMAAEIQTAEVKFSILPRAA